MAGFFVLSAAYGYSCFFGGGHGRARSLLRRAMVLMTTLFFLFRVVTNFNDVLMPYLKDVCQLTDLQSSAVQSAFFGAYFLMSLLAGWVLKKLGYQRGIVVGLLVMAGGALLFVCVRMMSNLLDSSVVEKRVVAEAYDY